MDAVVRRRAEYHTDYQLLCMKVRMTKKEVYHRRTPTIRIRRFDVSKLAKSKGGDHSDHACMISLSGDSSRNM